MLEPHTTGPPPARVAACLWPQNGLLWLLPRQTACLGCHRHAKCSLATLAEDSIIPLRTGSAMVEQAELEDLRLGAGIEDIGSARGE